jgi:hypothetical protein
MIQSKSDFYEVVTVTGLEPGIAIIVGERGYVAGRALDEGDSWGCAVYIYSQEKCWCVGEEMLTSTGTFDEHERDRAKQSIRVNLKGEIIS